MSDSDPIVMISSYPPRLCGIATFVEEAREFVQKANPDNETVKEKIESLKTKPESGQ